MESMSASECLAICHGSPPLGGQSEMGSKGPTVAPKRETMFGCAKGFDITTT